jgi:hypothetical protein
MKGLERKKEIILQSETAFADAIGAKVFEKPGVSFWMILLPILFLHLLYRMQKYKAGRLKFNEEFLVTRRRALDLAAESVEKGAKPDVGRVAAGLGLTDALEKPYGAWLKTLVEHYADLLAGNGDSLEALTRSAYRGKMEFLLTLNRIGAAEKEFYTALKPSLAATEGAGDIIGVIQSESQRLRRDLADRIFS